MTILRSLFVVGLAFLWPSWANAEAQKLDGSPTSVEQQVLSLNFTNDGQHLAASVGQQIEITLRTIGPGQYGTPQVSSPSIRFENVAWPGQIPAGPTQIFIFDAAAEGEAQVHIPHTVQNVSFTVTIQVGLAAGKPHASIAPDQANTAAWMDAWTNMLNDVQQTFMPSLPRLTSVEVELVVANPGSPDDEVTMNILNAGGEVLAVVSKTVPVADSGHVRFVFPDGGLPVSPGRVYSIRLIGGGLFGWKYVVGGYVMGAALFNGRPLLGNTRSTFLFRTFGAN